MKKKQSLSKHIKTPLVSVVLTIENDGRLVIPAINSILTQTYPRIELCIALNGVNNEAWKQVKKIKKTHPHIRVFRLPTAINPLAAINSSIPRLKGTFIALTDENCIWAKTKIEKQVGYLVTHPDTIAVGSFAKISDPKKHRTQYKWCPTDPENISRILGLTNPLELSTLMVNQNALPNKNVLFSSFHGESHFDTTIFALLTRGKLSVIPEFLTTIIHVPTISLAKKKRRTITNLRSRIEAVTRMNYTTLPPFVLAFCVLGYVILQIVPDALLGGIEAYIRGTRAFFRSIRNSYRRAARHRIRYAFPFS